MLAMWKKTLLGISFTGCSKIDKSWMPLFIFKRSEGQLESWSISKIQDVSLSTNKWKEAKNVKRSIRKCDDTLRRERKRQEGSKGVGDHQEASKPFLTLPNTFRCFNTLPDDSIHFQRLLTICDASWNFNIILMHPNASWRFLTQLDTS